SWNLRSNSSTSIGATSNGFLVPPGNYFVSISFVQNGLVEELVTKQSFTVIGLNNQTLLAKNSAELVLFRNDVAALNQKINNASNWLDEVNDVLKEMQSTLINYPNTELTLLSETRALKLLYDEAALVLWGDKIKSSREFETLPSINDRMGMVEYQLYENTAGVSNTHRANKAIAEEQYNALSISLGVISNRMMALQEKLNTVPIPYTKTLSRFWK
ncbi:MAG: hypothetical protein RL059_721, partial [Bacteroidota bacterium]